MGLNVFIIPSGVTLVTAGASEGSFHQITEPQQKSGLVLGETEEGVAGVMSLFAIK